MGSLILAVDTVSSQYEDLGTFHKCSYTKTNTSSRRLGKIKHIFFSVSHVPLDVTKSLEPLTENADADLGACPPMTSQAP